MFDLYDHLLPPGTLGAPPDSPGRWPGILYAWLPEPWTDLDLPPDEKFCLGVECWNLRRLTFFDADCIVNAIRRRSPPISQASLIARVLYQKGFTAQSQAVERMYGSEWASPQADQIRRTHDGSFFQPRANQKA